MTLAPLYLIQRFFYRIFEFLRHWYVGGFLAAVHQTLNVLERLDRVLALKITLRYIFKPLYQDYSPLGYFLGFIFRGGRLLIGGLVYLVVILIATVLYIGWAAVPIFIVYQGFYGTLF